MMALSPGYFARIKIVLSQLLNVVFCNGDPDEMLSARAYRMQHVSRRWMVARQVFDKLFFWNTEHCYESYLWEKSRKDIHSDYYPQL